MKEELKMVIQDYADAFAAPKCQIGTTDLIQFDIELKEDAKPVKHRLRPLNPKQRKSLRAQMDLWLKEGVIEQSNSQLSTSSSFQERGYWGQY